MILRGSTGTAREPENSFGQITMVQKMHHNNRNDNPKHRQLLTINWRKGVCGRKSKEDERKDINETKMSAGMSDGEIEFWDVHDPKIARVGTTNAMYHAFERLLLWKRTLQNIPQSTTTYDTDAQRTLNGRCYTNCMRMSYKKYVLKYIVRACV